MVMTPKSGLLLAGACISAIAAVGCVFELTSGDPDLGINITAAILTAAIPLTGLCFWGAVLDAKANLKD